MRTKQASVWAVALGLVVATGAGVGFGQGCPEVVGVFQAPPGLAYTVAVAGAYAYVGGVRHNPPPLRGVDQSLLWVADISTPSSPFEVGSCETSPYVWDIAVAGSHAYLASASCLEVVDISDPATPVVVGFSSDCYTGYDLAVVGDYAYVVGSLSGVGSGMVVIDVSDPTAPVTVGFYDTIWPMRVAVAGTHAYVADHETGLRIVDVSNPAEPVEVGSYDTLGPAAAVAVAGSYAYVADVGYGLRVINISDPQEPFEVGFCDWFEVWDEDDLAVAGGYVYYRSWAGLLRVIDISNPRGAV